MTFGLHFQLFFYLLVIILHTWPQAYPKVNHEGSFTLAVLLTDKEEPFLNYLYVYTSWSQAPLGTNPSCTHMTTIVSILWT